MELFDVYQRFDLTPVRAKGCYLWDDKGNKYLDLYGGHAVISVGHAHPHYLKRLSEQLNNIGFYSNSVRIPMQESVSALLGEQSSYEDFQLFFCNSGAEANENAIKLASFHNGKKKVLSFTNAFHGRTAAAVAATDNKAIVAPVNNSENFIFAPLNDIAALEQIFGTQEISSVIIEGIQGVAGVQLPDDYFMKAIENLCRLHNAVFIVDEIQSGYGRTGKFFAHQFSGVKPDMITIAKGMGNGFPVAGVLISPEIKPRKGMLGTTFGGNHLACAAALSVLEIIGKENLMGNADKMGSYFVSRLMEVSKIKEVRSRGLMIGVEMYEDCKKLRMNLIKRHRILTGNASQPNTLRVLPPLTVTEKEVDLLIEALKDELNV